MTKPTRPIRSAFRYFLVRFAVVCSFCVLAARLVYVQGFIASNLEQKVKQQLLHAVDPGRPRAPIVDSRRVPLAESVQVHSCFVDPKEVKSKRDTAQTLASLLNMNEASLYRRMRQAKGRFMWVKRNVPIDVVNKIKAKKIAGVAFRSEYRRHYPQGDIASHLLGLVGVDGHGLSGIEQKFDGSLMPGERFFKSGSGGFPDGTVQLTIDAGMQKIAERELDWGAKKCNARRGTVIIQEPATGKILALAAWPPMSLNPHDPSALEKIRVPPLSDAFEPGSTFKIVIAAAALEENLAQPHEIFYGENGSWKVSTIKIRDHEPRGRMTFEEIFIFSSNIGSAKIAERVGSERLYQYARLFGFGTYPGSGLSGETKGVLRHPTQWSAISKHVVSFGQEIAVTALQLVNAYSCVANEGVLMEPRIVQAVLSEDGQTVWEASPQKVRRVISEKTARALKDILTKAVDRGTGQNAQVRWNTDCLVAGKTGTAQKFDTVLKRYRMDLSLVSFCGFFPADKPKMTMLVILDDLQGRRWGGTDAAPIFRRIAEQISSKYI